MPAVTPNSSTKVLVTGANGFVATWLVRNLLEKGYSVRGTVRSSSKIPFLKELFKEYGDMLELIVVEDIIIEGAFDEAVRGIDVIQHIASPFHYSAVDPDDLLVPCLKGTLGLLESARKYGTDVKRVVTVSSCANVCDLSVTDPTVFTEKNWNESSVEEVQRLGKDASGLAKYGNAKTLTERAAWDFMAKHKDRISWDLTAINPTYIFGPVSYDVASPQGLNFSSGYWYSVVVAGLHNSAEQLGDGQAWIDVRDLAVALTLAQETEAAGGERILVSASPFIWQDWLNAINKLSPPPTKHTISKGFPKLSHLPLYQYDTSKATRILGLGESVKFRTIEETASDILRDFEARGW